MAILEKFNGKKENSNNAGKDHKLAHVEAINVTKDSG